MSRKSIGSRLWILLHCEHFQRAKRRPRKRAVLPRTSPKALGGSSRAGRPQILQVNPALRARSTARWTCIGAASPVAIMIDPPGDACCVAPQATRSGAAAPFGKSAGLLGDPSRCSAPRNAFAAIVRLGLVPPLDG